MVDGAGGLRERERERERERDGGRGMQRVRVEDRETRKGRVAAVQNSIRRPGRGRGRVADRANVNQ